MFVWAVLTFELLCHQDLQAATVNPDPSLKEFEGATLRYASLKLRNRPATEENESSRVNSDPEAKCFAVRSLGWVEMAEEDLAPGKSSVAVNNCIRQLSYCKNDIRDTVGIWGEVRDIVWSYISIPNVFQVLVLDSYSSSSALSGTGLRGQQNQQRRPDVPLPRHLLQLLKGEPKAFPGQPRDIIPPACSGSFRWDVPGTPPEEGVQEASSIDGRAASTGSSRCGGAAALLRAPPGWPSSSPYL
ncbi:hypothetical protein ATANTOWER_020862 [Ataeniobius toweri]|uniref:PID domain-containing protein n=1 Tax=Ataeniobius toweri TaxID=208326 RepID=A0ABU7CAY2_9TELE|nr:hypothetical protein [Ataeniobius toweri]